MSRGPARFVNQISEAVDYKKNQYLRSTFTLLIWFESADLDWFQQQFQLLWLSFCYDKGGGCDVGFLGVTVPCKLKFWTYLQEVLKNHTILLRRLGTGLPGSPDSVTLWLAWNNFKVFTNYRKPAKCKKVGDQELFLLELQRITGHTIGHVFLIVIVIYREFTPWRRDIYGDSKVKVLSLYLLASGKRFLCEELLLLFLS